MQSNRLPWVTIIAAVAVGVMPLAASSQESKPHESTDAVIKSIHSFAAAFNAGNAKKLADHFAEDGEYIDDSDTLFKGRENIEAEFAAFFKAIPGSELTIDVNDIRFVGNAMAIEEGTAAVTQGTSGSVTVSRYIVVHVRSKNRWQIASARDLDSEPASNHDRLKPLEWLIGDWVDQSDKSTVESSISWSEDGNYIISNFHVNVAGVRSMSGTQRIGWDPQKQQIRSWVFDSHGGFGSGLWTETDHGWVVKATAVLPDGSNGSGTSTYAKTGKDSFRLTLSQRIVAGNPQQNVSIDVVRRPPAVTR